MLCFASNEEADGSARLVTKFTTVSSDSLALRGTIASAGFCVSAAGLGDPTDVAVTENRDFSCGEKFLDVSVMRPAASDPATER